MRKSLVVHVFPISLKAVGIWYCSKKSWHLLRQLSLKISSEHDTRVSFIQYINKTTEHMEAKNPHLNTKDNGNLTGFISQIW